jgi:hypothetical protein
MREKSMLDQEQKRALQALIDRHRSMANGGDPSSPVQSRLPRIKNAVLVLHYLVKRTSDGEIVCSCGSVVSS